MPLISKRTQYETSKVADAAASRAACARHHRTSSARRANPPELTRFNRSHDALDDFVEHPGAKLDGEPDFGALANRRAAHDLDAALCALDNGPAHTQDIALLHHHR